MTDASFLAAVDVGSTSARAGIFDAGGKRLARAEQPLAVCSAVRKAVKESGVAGDRVGGLAFDATCSLVMLDGSGRPVTVSSTGLDAWNVVMWADHRAIAEAAEISATK